VRDGGLYIRVFGAAAGRIWVNGNPMGTDERPQLLSAENCEEYVGPLQRHVALNAFLPNLLAHLPIFSADLCLVAGEASGRQGDKVALLGMYVVAGGAGHAAGLKTAAAAQELHLVGMDVDGRIRAWIGNFQEFVDRVSGKERKRGRNRSRRAGVA
jgi:hypothetical protein